MLLQEWSCGNKQVLDELMPMLYDQLSSNRVFLLARGT